MTYSVAIRKLIVWFTAIVISLLPVALAVTDNLQVPHKILIVEEYGRYQSELLFLTISINTMAVFDAVDVVMDMEQHEAVLRLCFCIGQCILIVNLIVSSTIFGSLSKMVVPNDVYLYVTLLLVIASGAVIKFFQLMRTSV